MKYLLPLNKTSVIANRIGQTKGTAEPCNIPGVARQGSFGRRTSEGTIGKRHASNKYGFPFLMASYFCSFNHKGLVLVRYDPVLLANILKWHLISALYMGKLLDYCFLTTQIQGHSRDCDKWWNSTGFHFSK